MSCYPEGTRVCKYRTIDDFDSRSSIFKIKVEAVERCIEALVAAGYYMPSDIIEIKNYNDFELKTISESKEARLAKKSA